MQILKKNLTEKPENVIIFYCHQEQKQNIIKIKWSSMGAYFSLSCSIFCEIKEMSAKR